MISAGRLDRTIQIERPTRSVGVAGSETLAWTPVATVRAELIQSEISETLAAQGTTPKAALAFRIRYLAGVTPDDRVIYEGRAYNLRTVKEIGRRRGLELICEGST